MSKDHQALRKNGDSTRPRCALLMRASAAWLRQRHMQEPAYLTRSLTRRHISALWREKNEGLGGARGIWG